MMMRWDEMMLEDVANEYKDHEWEDLTDILND